MSRLYELERDVKALQKCVEQLKSAVDPVLTVTRTPEIEVFASGRQNVTVTTIARNSTITRTAAGRYTVAFTSAHPDGANYEVLFGVEEDANRDIPKASVIDGSKTATGFNMTLTVDDNGGAADGYNDEPWSFAVLYEGDEITDVVLT